MKKIIIILAFMILQGCSSIPLSTMWKMKSFDQDDFTQISPQHLRAKLRINKQITINDESLTLFFSFKSDSEELEEELALKLLSTSSNKVARWFSEDEQEYSYEFRLNEASMRAFKRIQQSSIAKRINNKEEREVNFSATWKLGDNKPEIYKFSIDLQFDPKDGYFTLLEGVELDTSKAQQVL